ncbi:MAG: nascent polypeptide-associated complex protein [Candidatus Micrarchaeota archaeon]|nr:nascent polypeptide-associated complex protein [Candidatus Micrarchaeota archaeon]MDE1849824.1 nascent polypeptide-associated complex protein [Candidatus Micrarchaeota archaeon]
MFPNIDPRQLKSMMDKMGIKQHEVDALRVIIEGKGVNIIIENPQVTVIEAQGTQTFQIVGDVKEVSAAKAEISDDDIRMVKEQSGVDDETLVRKALEETNGDIAEAIIRLKGKKAL